MAYLDESGVTSLTADIKALADGSYAPINHVHSVATQSANGFISSADKLNLDSLEDFYGIQLTTVLTIPV